jgi:hypothetical protein
MEQKSIREACAGVRSRLVPVTETCFGVGLTPGAPMNVEVIGARTRAR